MVFIFVETVFATLLTTAINTMGIEVTDVVSCDRIITITTNILIIITATATIMILVMVIVIITMMNPICFLAMLLIMPIVLNAIITVSIITTVSELQAGYQKHIYQHQSHEPWG